MLYAGIILQNMNFMLRSVKHPVEMHVAHDRFISRLMCIRKTVGYLYVLVRIQILLSLQVIVRKAIYSLTSYNFQFGTFKDLNIILKISQETFQLFNGNISKFLQNCLFHCNTLNKKLSKYISAFQFLCLATTPKNSYKNVII